MVALFEVDFGFTTLVALDLLVDAGDSSSSSESELMEWVSVAGMIDGELVFDYR